ncbi:MAG TPA: serine protease [Pirellulales bacterium]|nr:serine protease [Pirellulales bacterium]
MGLIQVLLRCAAGFALIVCWETASAIAPASDFNVAEARKGVVFVRRITPGRETALGSGFLVSTDGVIYTSRHVIEPTDSTARGTLILVGVPSAADPDDLDWFPAAVAYRPPKAENLDFAILKITARQSYGPFHALPLSYEKLELGASVAVIGYPYIRENEAVLSFNKGSISSTRVRFSGKTYYQTDAAVNHGNSGGPLINGGGEAVGIVTLKEMNAENVGFALYLSEIRATAEAAARHLDGLRSPIGPVDPRHLNLPVTIGPQAANWDAGAGRPRDEARRIVIDNHGGTYWLTSRVSLSDNFQLVVPCAVEYLQGSATVGAEPRNLRNIYVRFGADPQSPVPQGGGYLVRFSHAGLTLYRDGKSVKSVAQGNSQQKPLTLSITKQSGDFEIAVDGRVLLQWRDPRPLPVRRPFSIGGYLSRLSLGEVAVVDLTKKPQPTMSGTQATAAAKAEP